MSGIGFHDLIQKLGIERRVLTTGENKGFLNPFSPTNPHHKTFTKTMLEKIHHQCIKVVREGRGTRLKETGLLWD